MHRRAQREDVAVALRERLHAADRAIVPPQDLWDRIRTPGQAPAAPPQGRPRPRLRAVMGAAAAALAVGSIAGGAWWLSRPAAPSAPGPAAGGGGAVLTVYNAEAACRPLRTMECALRITRDPYAPYASPGNEAGEVWNGDRLPASCVVIDGTLVEDESGVTSTRWYLVSTAQGTHGWLPGVRTRNTTDVRVCTSVEIRGNLF